MEYIKLPLGNGQMNGYIIFDKDSKEAAIIDPGYDFKIINKNILDLDLTPKYILLTHSHGDHIGAVEELKDNYKNLKLGINVNEVEMLYRADLNLSSMIQPREISLESDFTFIDGEIIKLGEDEIKVLHIPGHSPGGSGFLIDGHVFVGDSLFKMSIGRTDFYMGDLQVLLTSIKTKLFILDGETIVHPGHGPDTSIAFEIERNPFF